MHHGHRQIIAEKVSSTVRILELLGLRYSVDAPKHTRKKGNKSPRVITVHSGGDTGLKIYNGIEGHTWASDDKNKPVVDIGSIEDIYAYLCRHQRQKRKTNVSSKA